MFISPTMLSKEERISRSFFPSVLKRGKSLHAAHLSLKYLPAAHGGQFSLVVSKRVIKQAVGRHRLKRQVYSVLRELQRLKKARISGVFFAKQGSEKLSFKEISEEVGTLLAQVRA